MTSDPAWLPHLPRRDHPWVEPADVGGPSAWRAMVGSGVLVPAWQDRAVAAAAPITAEDRAAVLAASVPPGGVLARRTAAWVHTGAAPPRRLDVLLPRSRRRPPDSPGYGYHQERLAAAEVLTLAGVPVTAMARTAADVARHEDDDELATTLLAALVDCGLAVPDAAAALERGKGRTGVRRARALLAGLP